MGLDRTALLVLLICSYKNSIAEITRTYNAQIQKVSADLSARPTISYEKTRQVLQQLQAAGLVDGIRKTPNGERLVKAIENRHGDDMTRWPIDINTEEYL